MSTAWVVNLAVAEYVIHRRPKSLCERPPYSWNGSKCTRITSRRQVLFGRPEMSEVISRLRGMRQQLNNNDGGRYLVTTATGSHYVLDLDARTVKRTMASTAPLLDFLEAGFSRLRRDGEEVELLLLETCEVGVGGRYWLQIRDDDIPTLRATSPIVRIEELADLET